MLKGIVSGVEKDINRIPMKVGNEYKEGWEVRDNRDRLIWGREDELQTVTGTLSLKGYGLPVKVKSLLGNGQQTGTPTPDNPVMPTFCGVRTGNLLNLNRTYSNSFTTDTTKWMNGAATVNNAGTVYAETEILGDVIKVTSKNAGYGASFLIEASPNTTYTVSFETDKASSGSWGGISDRDINGTVISQAAIEGKSATFTTHVNCAFLNVCFRFPPADGTVTFSNIMLNAGSTALPYEPFGYKIPLTCAGQTVPVYLSEVPTVRRVKKLVLTGEEETDFYRKNVTSADNSLYYIRFTALPSAPISRSPLYCTHLQNLNHTPSTEVGINVAISYSVMYFNLGLDVMNAQPSGNTVAGLKEYLAQQYANGTPVTVWYVLAEPETAIVNEPLCKIGDYADELNDTVATLPEIPTTTGRNTLTVDTAIAPYEVTIEGHIKYGYWGKIREAVRSGAAQTMFPVGTIFYDNEDETTGTAFQVVGYDNHFDPAMTARGYTHSMTLCELKLTDLVTFDAIEALLYVETAIAPGTYRFKIPNYDATYGGNKSYYFTTTKSIPVGGQIVISWSYQQTPKTVATYSEIAGVTAIESGLTLSEWIEGESPVAIDLGTAAGPNAELGTSNFGKMNHIHRARYGNNNYMQSGIRQYINSDKYANSWWSPQTIFDRPYGSRTSAGKLTKLSSEFVDVLVRPTIKSRTNNYFEVDSLDGTQFSVSTDYTITTDKMFLLSPNEVGLNADTTIGSTLDYYLNATDAERIKHRASNEAAYYWWLRTPNPTNARSVRNVYTSGALNNNYASNASGVAAACVIQ